MAILTIHADGARRLRPTVACALLAMVAIGAAGCAAQWPFGTLVVFLWLGLVGAVTGVIGSCGAKAPQ